MNHNRRVNARWVAFLVWAGLAGSAVFWALRLFVAPTAVPGQAVTVAPAAAARGDLSRLFGRGAAPPEQAVEPPAPSRFKLIGVVAPRQESDAAVALALISVDNEPAKAYRLGAVVDGQTVLQEVRARGASLGPRGGPGMALELAPPIPAATGTLPGVGGAAPVSPVRPVLPVPVSLSPPPIQEGELPQVGDAVSEGAPVPPPPGFVPNSGRQNLAQ